jgi:putative ATP-binding cassette transporter
MSLGQVMQAASAFTIVQTAFNWPVDNYLPPGAFAH